ncbi:glycosyl transferase family 2 [Carboxydothermus islandicus]|uniref:Glucosyl-3-phosphoglycerate synthase n=1 Tax=Carboxydothermus islandicus TaxID=661089 RepID=A0A1L8D039_9THEO|nr:glycosyltransferase family 2 protein [Carboxydothermus islandicus]GAV24545.1 glycosyl transferase family 2 [Carboxydothermus islandicus]
MTVEVLIPAYNEEKNIGRVIASLKKLSLIDKIIVIDDGSKDKTAIIARQLKADVISLGENRGKGAALFEGFKNSRGDIIAFLDADLVNLTARHVINLLLPVIKEEAVMTVGIFNQGRFATDFAQKITPFLSGQRAFQRWFLEEFFAENDDIEQLRYGIEVSLTLYAKKRGIKVIEVPLPHLTHVMKEEKFGLIPGMIARAKMYRDIVFSFGSKFKF